MTKKKRAKNEPTKGDLLAQDYRNRAAMTRVYAAAVDARNGVPAEVTSRIYWLPLNMNAEA